MDVELLARTSAVLAAAAALATLMRGAASSTRHLVWQLAIIIVLLAPALAPLAPEIAILPNVPDVPLVPQGPKAVFSTAVATVPIVPNSGTQQNNAIGTIGTVGTMATLLWFGFCWLLSGVAVWRSKIAPAEWLHEGQKIARRMGMTRVIDVREMNRDGSPHVAGLFRSVVMLPPSAGTWTAEARHAALVHELMHIRRGDRRTLALAQLACAIYWFNPLVWYASAALARERERACDDEVLRSGAKPSAYASLLLDLARAQSVWTPATALSMARPSAIEGRLLLILGSSSRTARRSTRWLVTALLAVMAVTILGAQPIMPSVLLTAPTADAQEAPKPKAPDLMKESLAQPERSITDALVSALDDSDGQVREQAAMGLALTPGGDVIAPLLKALSDTDPQVREKAAIGLSFRRDSRIVAPLLGAIEDPDAQVREKAAIALGASGDTRAVDALRKAMRDPDSQVREKAVAGLVLLGLRQ
jgi:beta-lactamase regulating signal transducer with metallopeptidase domain